MKTYRMLIDGKFTESLSGETFDVTDPSTEKVIAKAPLGGRNDAKLAIESARKAFDSGPWPKMTQKERIKRLLALAGLMKKREPDLMGIESRQGGIPIRKTTLMDIPVGIEMFCTMVEASDFPTYEPLPWTDFPNVSWNFVNREPIGVCAAITAWNYPWLFTIWKSTPALAMGNTLVLKPATFTPLTAIAFAEMAAEADIPPGVFNLVTGPGSTVGAQLCESPLVDKVSFTGHTETAREIQTMAAGNIKRLALELGGKSAVIVLDDAWLDLSVDMALFAAFFNSGQSCEAGTRLLLQKGIYKKFMEKLLDRMKLIKLGPTDDFETTMGPLISEGQRKSVEGYIASGIEEGAKLVYGGKRPEKIPENIKKGYYLEPTIFENVTRDMKIFQEEIFGPVLAVTGFATESEAIELANDSVYGLAGAVFTANVPKGIEMAKRMRTGTVWVNDYHLLNASFPFGGFKQSGKGHEMSEYALKEYTEIKHVHVDQVGDKRDTKFWLDYIINRD